MTRTRPTPEKRLISPATRWHVITGAPCSGKTTVIRRLEASGFRVVHEAARAYIDAEIQKGKTLADIRTDEAAFQSRIIYLKQEAENALDPDETVFIDRGIPDSIAYFRLSGLDPDEPIRLSRPNLYRTIFFFERLPFQADGVRAEDDAVADRLDRLLKDAYRMVGYPLIHVPVMPPPERTAWILARL